MKKYILAVLLCCVSVLPATAEMRFGVKLEPRMAFNRVYAKPYDSELKAEPAVLRLGVGPVCDWLIQENCYISSGVQLSSQPVAYKSGQELQNTLGVDYLSFPILLKLYTSEVSLDTRIYTELGAGLQLKISERIHKLEIPGTIGDDMARRWVLRATVGVGVEYDLSLSTSLFGGITYHRGLTNAMNSKVTTPPVCAYNDTVGLSVGFRF